MKRHFDLVKAINLQDEIKSICDLKNKIRNLLFHYSAKNDIHCMLSAEYKRLELLQDRKTAELKSMAE